MKKNFLLVLVLASINFMIGCAKDPIDPGYARYMIVNAAPDLANIDVFVDDFKQNISPIAFGSNTIYNGITPGSRTIAVKLGGINSVFSQATYSVKLNEANRPNYTFVASNLSSTPDLIWIEDDLTLPAVGKANLRIINASSDAPALNAYNGTATTPIFSAASYKYKEFSPFVPIDALSTGTSYSVQIRNVATNAVLRTQTFTAVAGKIYTIIVRGLVTPTFAYPANTLSSTFVGNN